MTQAATKTSSLWQAGAVPASEPFCGVASAVRVKSQLSSLKGQAQQGDVVEQKKHLTQSQRAIGAPRPARPPTPHCVSGASWPGLPRPKGLVAKMRMTRLVAQGPRQGYPSTLSSRDD